MGIATLNSAKVNKYLYHMTALQQRGKGESEYLSMTVSSLHEITGYILRLNLVWDFSTLEPEV